MAKKRLSTISKVLFLQLLVIATCTFCFALTKGKLFANGAVLGGMAAFIPNLYFALKIKKSEGQEAKKIVRTFYAGESGKWFLTVVMFLLIFKQYPDIKFFPLMAGYVSALSVFWFVLILRD